MIELEDKKGGDKRKRKKEGAKEEKLIYMYIHVCMTILFLPIFLHVVTCFFTSRLSFQRAKSMSSFRFQCLQICLLKSRSMLHQQKPIPELSRFMFSLVSCTPSRLAHFLSILPNPQDASEPIARQVEVSLHVQHTYTQTLSRFRGWEVDLHLQYIYSVHHVSY